MFSTLLTVNFFPLTQLTPNRHSVAICFHFLVLSRDISLLHVEDPTDQTASFFPWTFFFLQIFHCLQQFLFQTGFLLLWSTYRFQQAFLTVPNRFFVAQNHFHFLFTGSQTLVGNVQLISVHRLQLSNSHFSYQSTESNSIMQYCILFTGFNFIFSNSFLCIKQFNQLTVISESSYIPIPSNLALNYTNTLCTL